MGTTLPPEVDSIRSTCHSWRKFNLWRMAYDFGSVLLSVGKRGQIRIEGPCGGNSSHCPIVQIGMAYVNNRFGVRVGVPLPVPLGFNIGFSITFLKQNRTSATSSVPALVGVSVDFMTLQLSGCMEALTFICRKIEKPSLRLDWAWIM